MNKKLTEQILSLVRTMTVTEINDFKKGARSNTNYIELFEIFIKYRKSKALSVESKIDNDGKKLNGSYNDTKENLLQKLLDYIRFKENQEDKLINRARKLIDTTRALISRKQYELACEKVYNSFSLLNEIKISEKNYHLYLEYLDVVTEIQKGRQFDIESRNLPTKFDDEKIIQWLNSIIYTIANSNIPKPKDVEVSHNFSNNLFFNLYIDYLKNKEDYIYLDKYIYETKIDNFRNSILQGRISKTASLINGVYNTLNDLYLLEIALKINHKVYIDDILRRLESNAQLSYNGQFNTQIYIFLVLHIQSFRLNIGLDLEEPILLPKVDNIYPEISDFNLFTENQINKTALRIEINRGVIFLFTERPEKAYKIFGSIKSAPTASPEIKFYLALFEIIAHRASMKEFNNDNYNNLLDAAKRIKTKGSEYSTKFLRFLINNTDRRIFTKKAKEFQIKNTPFNTFDKVLHYWLTTMLPNR